MRTLRFGVLAGVLLVLAGAVGAHAAWEARQPAAGGLVTSGDLDVAANWRDGTPAWGELLPGEHADATVHVTAGGTGTTLHWRIRLEEHHDPAFSSTDLTFQAWQGSCSAPGEPFPASGLTMASAHAEIDVCVRYALAAGAANALQGQEISPRIDVIAEQVAS